MSPPCSVLVYECALCHPHLYFQSYSKAARHLGINHSSSIKSNSKDKTRATRIGQKGDAIINSLEFFHPTIKLNRLTLADSGKAKKKLSKIKPKSKEVNTKSTESESDQSAKSQSQAIDKSDYSASTKIKAIPMKSKKINPSVLRTATAVSEEIAEPKLVRAKGPRPRMVRGQTEIRLETLKASEIEVLVGDLFKPSSSSLVFKPKSNSADTNGKVVRKSRRKVKERFKRNYGELDSEDEEIIRIGSGRGTKPRKNKNGEGDEDFMCDSGSSTESEWDDEMTRSGRSKSQDETAGRYIADRSGRKLKKFKQQVRVKNKDGEWEIQEVEIEREKEPKCKGPITSSYWCRICDSRFIMPKEYLEHMKRDHLGEDNKYTCPHCKTGFFPLKKFNKHMKRHARPRSCFNKPPKPKPSPGSRDPTAFRFQCEVCYKKYRDRYALKRHMKTHDKSSRATSIKDASKPHACPKCHIRCTTLKNLRRHFFLHLESNPYQCKFSGCEQRFGSLYDLQRHIRLHTSRVMLNCHLCSCGYTRQDALNKHLAQYHPNGKPISPEDLKRLKRHSRLFRVRDINDLASDRQFPLGPKDPTTIKNEEDFRVELESVHLSDRILKTENDEVHVNGMTLIPEKRPRSRSTSPLIEEGGSVSGERKTNNRLLTDSGESYVDVRKVLSADPEVKRLHEESVHFAKIGNCKWYNKNNKMGDFKCDMCGWIGSQVHTLQSHKEKQHNIPAPPFSIGAEPTEENPLGIELICAMCGYKSVSSDDLATHITKSHVKDKKFHCQQCGIRFAEKLRLDLHIKKVHIMEKLSCTKCDAKYSSKTRLKQHVKVKHDPEYIKRIKASLICDVCSKVLSSKTALDTHKRLHTSSRPLSTCQICNQTCAGSGSLKRHIQNVHMKGINPQTNKKNYESGNGKSSSSDMVEATGGVKEGILANSDKEKTGQKASETDESGEIVGF